MTDSHGAYTVYQHTGPTGKVYIGITRDSVKRRWKGGNGYAYNDHFFRAIKKYGWAAFKHEILAEGLTEDQAISMERRLIAAYDSTDPAKGYNQDPGGGVRSKATAEKISAALAGVPFSAERRDRLSAQRKGRALSDEHKKRLSERCKQSHKVQRHIRALNASKAGMAFTEAHRKRIADAQPNRKEVINLDTGEIFASLREAAESCRGDHPNIVKVCTGQRQRAYGYRWAYKEVSIE